jgi:NCS1 family nucleobase:cation symporter-1
MCPWYWLANYGNYIFGWLVGYSGLLGPVAGIMVTDYVLIRGTRLDSYSLYRRGGVYEYTKGVNPAAMIALALGVAAALVGKFVPRVAFLYDYAWFVGFFLSGAIYYLMMVNSRVQDAGPGALAEG